MRPTRSLASLGLIAAVGCANVLGYDDVTFDQGTGGTTYGTGATGAAGSSSGGAGGAAGQPAGGGAPSGGATSGGGGSPSGGGGTPGGGGAQGGGGTPGGGGGAQGGGGSPSGGGGSPSGGGGTPSGGGGTPSGGGGTPSGGGGTPSGGGGSPSGGGGSPSGGGGTPSGGGGTPSGGGTTGGHSETLWNPNGAGNDPGGQIPVCCIPSSTEQSQIDQVFSLLNQYRVSKGLSALTYDKKLEAAVEGHCHHMAVHSFWGHNAPEAAVSSPWTRASLCGTSANGENLANGYPSATSVMDGWKGSPGHNANMLGNFKRVGIGKYSSYWGQLFGS